MFFVKSYSSCAFDVHFMSFGQQFATQQPVRTAFTLLTTFLIIEIKLLGVANYVMHSTLYEIDSGMCVIITSMFT